VRQILVNLISNAVKFTKKGEIVVTLNAEARTDREFALHFSVRDTGIGIAAERHSRLFKAFSQVDASTTRKYGGTGLGLAISKKLVNLMGGTIWVESAPGKGSTFNFAFPVTAAPASESLDLNSRQTGIEGKRVLIVDDNATSRRILSTITERWGMKSAAAGSGTEALSRLDSGEKFDLCLLDYEMPEMNGLNLAEKIRSRHPAESLPIVLMMNVGQRLSNKRLVDGALKKPVKYDVLLDSILRGLSLEGLQAAESQTGRPHDQRMASVWPLRILVAEDNLINQKVALRLLERLGYQADVVANGMEAVVASRHVDYDVVLMDVQMPEMDGLEATRQLCKQHPPEDRPRIIAVTADAQESDREECLRAGMDDYLSKPVRLDQVADALYQTTPRSKSSDDREHPKEQSVAVPARPADTKTPAAETLTQDTSAPELTEKLRHPAPPAARDDQAVGSPPSTPLPDQPAADTRADTNETASEPEGTIELLGEDDPEFLADLINSYLDMTPSMLTEMRRHLAAGDRGALKSVAHKMKSGSGQIGLKRLSGLCGDLQSASAGERAGINLQDQVGLIEAEVKRVIPLLRSKRESLANGK
jgi:CheY-like chemotaxis protein